jgi:hypothetical protein
LQVDRKEGRAKDRGAIKGRDYKTFEFASRGNMERCFLEEGFDDPGQSSSGFQKRRTRVFDQKKM